MCTCALRLYIAVQLFKWCIRTKSLRMENCKLPIHYRSIERSFEYWPHIQILLNRTATSNDHAIWWLALQTPLFWIFPLFFFFNLIYNVVSLLLLSSIISFGNSFIYNIIVFHFRRSVYYMFLHVYISWDH